MPTDLAAHGIRLRHHRPGEQRAACPECAAAKLRAGDDALAVRVDVDGSAVWHCHRCGWKGTTRRPERAPGRDRPPPRVSAPPAPRTRPMGLLSAARSLFGSASPITPGTVAAAYLQGRNCALPHPDGDLRWHPALRHPSGHVGPALVALVTDAEMGDPLIVHRTWLEPDGSGKAKAVDKPRLLMKGLPAKGGVVRLWPDEEVTLGLCVAEGIETALSAALGFGLAWATVDAGNLEHLPVLAGVEALTIVADHDRRNPRTGERAGSKAANACARRWAAAGREVGLWQAAEEETDFNDFARGAA